MKTLGEHIEVAESAEREGDWARAARLWSEAVTAAKTGKTWRRAGRRAAAAHRKAGDLTKAQALLGAVLAKHPDDALARRELARLGAALAERRSENRYWRLRRDFIYLKVVKQIATGIGGNANAILDVGSNETPILDWFPSTPLRVSVDRGRPYVAPHIVSVSTNFMNWNPMRRFDVGLCLQVLEHVPEPADFARRLLDLCDVTIISVPYRWPEDCTPYHLHDPVDEEKLHAWFGRPPNYSYKATELHGQERLACVYDRLTEKPWSSIREDDFKYRWSLRGAEDVLKAAVPGRTAD